MYRAVIAAAVAGFALSGCATKPVEAPANFAWSYSANPGEGAKLAFGRPQSDDVVLMMVCDGAHVRLSAAGLSSRDLMLTSNGTATSFNGSVSEGFAGSDGLIEASIPLRSPALQGFRQTGDLNMTSGGRVLKLSAIDADRPAVKRFFGECAAA